MIILYILLAIFIGIPLIMVIYYFFGSIISVALWLIRWLLAVGFKWLIIAFCIYLFFQLI